MNWPFQSTDEQVMWRVQHGGDPAAFAELVRRWETPIRRMCARMTGDLHRAEDLAQEAFSRVFSHRADFLPGSRFSTWLWRIALNLCRDELRRRNRRAESPLEDDDGEGERVGTLVSVGPDPSQRMVDGEQAEAVRGAVMELPEHYRTVLVLRHYEGLKFAEIAEVLGISEGTVKSRMAEGLTRLGMRLKARGMTQ
jgi:RNA polymerase sigma-70 factor (ECF subfamily)